MEFAYTYTWGVENYHREARELYDIYTLEEYVQVLEISGFNVERAESYLQPGYPENLEAKATLKVNGVEAEWFDSNALWIARKS